jgi:hypothetical protein
VRLDELAGAPTFQQMASRIQYQDLGNGLAFRVRTSRKCTAPGAATYESALGQAALRTPALRA